FQHGGVDALGMTRAMGKNLINAAQGRRLEGGSTITQQVAKNVLLTNSQTVGRKLQEAILARRLEQTLNKEQILELYLNEIWLGYRSYGVGAAAYNYFGKSINDLSLAECAYLAALPKGPDNYHPTKRKAQALIRRNWILGQMAELGWVSKAEAAAAEKEDLVVQTAPSRAKYRDADYFVEEVRQRALQTLGPRLNEGGYYMRTTLDPQLQTSARVALMKGLENYDRRHGWRGAWSHVAVDSHWEKEALAAPPAERPEWRRAIIDSVTGGVHIRTAKGDLAGNLAPEDVAWARGGKGLSVGDLIFVEPMPNGVFRLRQVPQVNGALVAIDPWSGRVLAMVGGYSFSLSNFNRATQAMRQPGSAFKPFVYATALENGFTPASTVLDARLDLKGANGEVWSPENYHKQFYGALPLRKGLEQSINAMTVRLAQSVGMSKVVKTAVDFGVVKDMEPVLAMALGAGETTPFKLTAAYAPFVNGGRRIEPHLIELVEDREGKTIFRADQRDCPHCDGVFMGDDESPHVPPPGKQVIDPITAYQMTSMLQGVVQRGTAAAVSSLGRPLAGKTGTTNEYRSAWFVGYSPNLIVGVFVGFDDNRSLGEGETGAVDSVPIFIDFMGETLKGQPVEDFKPPRNAKFGMVGGIREAFRPGTEPTRAVAPSASPSQPSGPIPYQDLGKDIPPAIEPPKPPPKPKQPDLEGLY
ncbi:MAG: penicillin-binding protein, partial [Caulobacter sp.]|nr:penicillin-binding protein [Caulobacter sp.]